MHSQPNKLVPALAAVLGLLLPALHAHARDNAPAGTYTASTGATAGRSHARGQAGGLLARRGQTEETTGAGITIRIDSYSTQSELDALVQAQQSGGSAAALKTLSGMSHGSVQIGGQSFRVNAISSVRTGGGWNIYLLSAEPFGEAGPRGRQVRGASAGTIVLHVDAGGSGDGMLYTSTQFVVESDGQVRAQAGGSTATALSSVVHGG